HTTPVVIITGVLNPSPVLPTTPVNKTIPVISITGIVYSTGVIPITGVGNTAPVISDTDVIRITGVVSTTGARMNTRVKKISPIQDLQNPYSAWFVENQMPFRQS